jgi:uncharacterized protein (TIGR04141 family)
MAKDNRKEKLSIYLIKEGLTNPIAFLKLDSCDPPISFETGGINVVLYVKKDKIHGLPPWTNLFISTGKVSPEKFKSARSVGAVAQITRENRTFLLSFSSGFHLLNMDAVERDFGLRVTLSAVDPDKLRSVDKASYEENPLNSRNQSTVEADIYELEMDAESEMLYALTGASNESKFGSQITGRDALTMFVETTLAKIGGILDEALKRYSSPLPPHFASIDNIRRVKDITQCALLDGLLDKEFIKPTGLPLWIGEPEIVDWEGNTGYSFANYGTSPRHVVLKLDDLKDHMAKSGKELTVANLKNQLIHICNSEYIPIRDWSAYRCLYAEVSSGTEKYVLRNAIWFKVDASFVNAIDDYVATIGAYPHGLPTYSYDTEGEYNENVFKSDPVSFSLMDKKNTKLGGQYDKVEFCDLTRGATDLIHVKFYRSSGTLSHLFSQGAVAGEAFLKDEKFRERLNPILPLALQLTDPKKIPQASGYTIVFAIATQKKLPAELPFFSKVTLRNSVRTLRALGYEVNIAEIAVDPNILVKKKMKPKKVKGAP